MSNTPYAVLADLNIPIYITTNYDHFMEAALRSKGKEPVSEFFRWNKYTLNTKFVSEPVFASGYKPSTSNPLVYHLHGSIEVPQSMVLTERDYNEFPLNMAEIELPRVIVLGLATSALIFIGYGLEDIDFRTAQSGLGRAVKANAGYGTTLVLLPPKEAKNENTLSERRYITNYAQLTSYGSNVSIYWGSASSFCYELRKHLEMYSEPASQMSSGAPSRASDSLRNFRF